MPLYNLARMSTATTGTGTITLGSAVTSYLSFADAGVADAATVTYAIVDGNSREIGRGVYTSSGTTLTRATILESTNGGSAISLSGSAEVFITAAAEDINFEGFLATKGSSQTGLTSGAETQVTYGTETFDIGGKFSSNTWTPSKGKVCLGFSAYAQDDDSGGYFTDTRAIIKKNGDPLFTWYSEIANQGSNVIVHFPPIIDEANGTDAYTFYLDCTKSSGTWAILTSDSYAFGYRIGGN